MPMVSPIFHARLVSRTPPNQGQCQRPHTGNGENNKGCSEIPWQPIFFKAQVAGGIQKFPAVLAFYGFVLNFFSAKRAFFHFSSLTVRTLSGERKSAFQHQRRDHKQYAITEVEEGMVINRL